nr:MAG TPA: transmembrane protein [Bacteriophage sp.]
MEKQVVYRGPGILGLLGTAFVVLKLVGVIDWSWWWVTIPFWGPIIVVLILLLIILLISGISVWLNIK